MAKTYKKKKKKRLEETRQMNKQALESDLPKELTDKMFKHFSRKVK